MSIILPGFHAVLSVSLFFTFQKSTGVHQCKPAHITWHCPSVWVLIKWKTILKITGETQYCPQIRFPCCGLFRIIHFSFSPLFLFSLFVISSCVLLYSICSFSQATVFGPQWASLCAAFPSGFHRRLHQEPKPDDMCKCPCSELTHRNI